MTSDKIEEAAERWQRLRGRLSSVMTVAREVSRLRPPGTATGELWHWECRSCDGPVFPVASDEHAHCSDCGSNGVSLRSVQEYESAARSAVPSFMIPNFIVTADEEVPALAAIHLETFDPAAVLSLGEALLALMRLHAADEGGRCGSCVEQRWPCQTAVALYGVSL